MYTIGRENTFKKDFRQCVKRNYDMNLLNNIVIQLANKGKLPAKFKPHKLKGNYKGHWECHLKPDWLLIWKQDKRKKEIILERTGTHSDLFG